jgi:ferredoxin
MDRRRAVSMVRLAGAYARHVATHTASRRRPRPDGLAEFARLYGRDRITPITPQDREEMPSHGLCVGCGLCTFAAPRAGYLRADRLPSQLTRTLPEMWTSRDLPYDDVDWQAGAEVCPMGVPLPRMRDFVARRLERDGVQPPAPQTPPRVLPLPGRPGSSLPA